MATKKKTNPIKLPGASLPNDQKEIKSPQSSVETSVKETSVKGKSDQKNTKGNSDQPSSLPKSNGSQSKDNKNNKMTNDLESEIPEEDTWTYFPKQKLCVFRGRYVFEWDGESDIPDKRKEFTSEEIEDAIMIEHNDIDKKLDFYAFLKQVIAESPHEIDFEGFKEIGGNIEIQISAEETNPDILIEAINITKLNNGGIILEKDLDEYTIHLVAHPQKD